jgi:hypothetical protein
LESRSNSNSVIGKSTTMILLMSLIFLFSTWYNGRHLEETEEN